MKLWDLSGYSDCKNNIQEAYLPKTSILGQIVSEILAQLCSDDSIQILLNVTQFITLGTESNLEGFVSGHRSLLPQNSSFWQVGLLDIVLSEYPDKSLYFTNLIFMMSSH